MGEEIAKVSISQMHSDKSSGKVLTKDIPRALPAMPLCTKIAIKMPNAVLISVHKPRARPSKNECIESATIIM